jgi:hypothetical protein
MKTTTKLTDKKLKALIGENELKNYCINYGNYIPIDTKTDNMETRILNTEELFRVTYDDGDFESLVKQTYTDGTAPFYTIQKGLHKLTPVETSSENLNEIERHLEKCLKIDSKSLKQPWNKNNPKVKAVIEHCLEKQREFLNKLRMLPEYESKLLAV